MTEGHVAWAVEFNLVTKEVRPLHPITNTWCATGGFVSNGTFFSLGGHPMVGIGGFLYLSALSAVDGICIDTSLGQTGLQSVRVFEPCEDESCDVFEDLDRLRLTSRRWYPSSVSLCAY
jgi:hypothetical protein